MKSLVVAAFLALKSTVRGNIGVTILTITMLTLANLNLLFVPSLINGIVKSANDKLISMYSGNIIVEAATENARNEISTIRNADELAEAIRRIEGVSGVAHRNIMAAEMTYQDERTACSVRSVSPEHEREVFSIADTMIEGSYLEPRDLDVIVLGVQLAGADRRQIEFYSSSLKRVHAGDRINVTWGNGVKKQYRVKGIFYTEFVQADVVAFVTDQEFKTISPMSANRAATIHIKTTPVADAQTIITRINSLRDGLKFKTWQETAGIITSMTNSFAAINSILTVVNLLLAGITVFIVTYIDLAHKRRQIGIERAIGITPQAIAMSYVFRAIFYALTGIFLSWLLYYYAVVPLEARYPFHFPFGDILLHMDQELLVRSSLVIFGVATVGALIPTWRAIRIRILDAIWG